MKEETRAHLTGLFCLTKDCVCASLWAGGGPNREGGRKVHRQRKHRGFPSCTWTKTDLEAEVREEWGSCHTHTYPPPPERRNGENSLHMGVGEDLGQRREIRAGGSCFTTLVQEAKISTAGVWRSTSCSQMMAKESYLQMFTL